MKIKFLNNFCWVKEIYDVLNDTNTGINGFMQENGIKDSNFKENLLEHSLEGKLKDYAEKKIAYESSIELNPETPDRLSVDSDPNIHKK